MNGYNILLSIGLSILLLGCNGNTTNNNNASKTEKISVPTAIDMPLPKPLTNSGASSTTFQKSQEMPTKQSRGYTQLKYEIENSERKRKIVLINLMLADRLMPQIETACLDIPVAQTCEIPKGELSFVLDSVMRSDIRNIIGEEFSADEADKKMTLGKTTFTVYPDSEDYQYHLVMDMSNMIERDSTDRTVHLQTLKWSKDENRVWSIYREGEASTMSLHYTKSANGQTKMEIDDSFNIEDETDLESNFHFKITKKADLYNVISNSSLVENSLTIGTHSSVGELSNKGGYLKFKGKFLENEYRETEKFYANGNVIFSGYCDESQACNLNDESTWLSHGEETL